MTPFRFVLLALTAYRLQRVITMDSWPPTARLRQFVARRFGEDSAWYDWVSCCHCIGTWIAVWLVVLDHFWWRLPTVVLIAGAAAAIVGQIGQRDQ